MKLAVVYLSALWACVEASELEMSSLRRSSTQASAALAVRVVLKEAPGLIGDDLTGQFVNMLQTAANRQSPDLATTNNSAIVTSIATLLDSMEQKLLEAHNASLQAIQNALAAIHACKLDGDGPATSGLLSMSRQELDAHGSPAAVQLAAKAGVTASAASPVMEPLDEQLAFLDSYAQCKKKEQELQDNLTQCDEYCLEEVTVKGLHCIEVDVQCDALTCDVADESETLKSYLQRMIAMMTALESVAPRQCNDHASTTATSCCDDVVEKSQKCFKSCYGVILHVVPTDVEEDLSACCAPLGQAEQGLCSHWSEQREKYEGYDECYNSTVHTLLGTVAEAQDEAAARKAQQRAILRIECLVQAFGPDMRAKFAQCLATEYTQDSRVLFFDIPTPVTPEKEENIALICPAEYIPGTPQYDTKLVHVLEGVSPCAPIKCTDVCNMTLPQTWTPPAPLGTTATTTAAPEERDCYRASDGTDAVYWDMGTSMPVETVAAHRALDTQAVAVYLTNAAPGTPIPSEDLCGEIVGTDPIKCTHQTASRYLILKGQLRGTQVSGEIAAKPSWCAMSLDGSPFPAQPVDGFGDVFRGYTEEA